MAIGVARTKLKLCKLVGGLLQIFLYITTCIFKNVRTVYGIDLTFSHAEEA